MKLYFIIIFFILLNAFFIISDNNLSIDSMENLERFFSLYLNWIKTTLNNITIISGNVVEMDWFPKKETT